MSHGKYDNNSSESITDRLNRWLGALMGKKSNSPNLKPKNQIPSNSKFGFILAFMILVLWLLTGVYYIPENYSGLIITNGKVSKSVEGLKIGITLPYPLATVETLDATNSIVYFGKESDNQVILSSKDKVNFQVSGEISYHISNPQQYFSNFYQETSDLDQKITWLTLQQIQQYALTESSSSILKANTAIVGNSIRSQSESLFAKYGLTLDKLNLVTVKRVVTPVSNNSVSESSNSSSDYAKDILVQANNYQADLDKQTQQITKDFNSLLPQYKANNSAITELLYYKLLSSLPAESSSIESYPLLNLSESQFIELNKNPRAILNIQNNTLDNQDPRALNRSVDRQREFGSR